MRDDSTQSGVEVDKHVSVLDCAVCYLFYCTIHMILG